MRRRIRSIERFERLEDRICPSGTTMNEFVLDGNGMDSDPSATESENLRYEWIMMVMTPVEMMKIANEIDQSAEGPGLEMVATETGAMARGMAGGKRTPAPIPEPAMAASSEMPPAQMVMISEPLVRPGSSSSSRTPAAMSEMAESNSTDAKSNSEADQSGSMAAGEMDPAGAYEPPRLAPGNLDPNLTPNLDPGPIGPALEQAQRSDSNP